MSNSFHINNKITESTVSVDNKKSRNAWHMAADPGIYEPQRLNTFEFLLDANAIPDSTPLQSRPDGNPGTIGQVLSSIKTYDAPHKAQEALRLAVSSAAIPSLSQGVIPIKRGNTEVKYAGSASFSGGAITIHDYIGLPALEVIYAWQALSFNLQTEKVGVAGDYKKTCTLVEYTPDYQMVRSWKLEGCWISELSEGSFDSSSDALHDVQVTIQYDRAYIDYRAGIDEK